MAHTLRLIEIMGRSDIPVVPGAEFPLVRTRAEAQMWQQATAKSHTLAHGMIAGGMKRL